MNELAIALERERQNLPPRAFRLADAREAARMEQWIKREPRPVVEPPPPPIARIRRKHVRKPAPQTLMEQLVEEFRRSLVQTFIASQGGNQGKAAAVLGIHRNTVNRIIRGRS